MQLLLTKECSETVIELVSRIRENKRAKTKADGEGDNNRVNDLDEYENELFNDLYDVIDKEIG